VSAAVRKYAVATDADGSQIVAGEKSKASANVPSAEHSAAAAAPTPDKRFCAIREFKSF